MGLMVGGFVSSGLVELFHPFFRITFVTLLFTLLPGEALRARLFPRAGGAGAAERIPVAFVTGLAFFAAVTLACELAACSFRTYTAVLQVVVFALFGVFFIAGFGRRDESPVSPPAAGVPWRVVLAVAVVLGLFMYLSPPVMGYRSDVYDHLGYLRTIETENTMLPAGVLAPVEGHEPPGKDPRKGVWHPFLAALGKLSKLDPYYVWSFLPVFLAPIAMLAFTVFARALLPGWRYVTFAVILFLMFRGGNGHEFLQTIAYGQHLAMVFFWILFAMFAGWLRDGGRVTLVAMLVIVFGGALVHIDVIMHVGLMYVALLAFGKPLGLGMRRLVTLGAGLVVVAGLSVGWKLATAYGPANLLHTHPQGLLYFWNVGDPHFVASPVEIIKKNGLLFFAGLCMVPGLLLVKRHRRQALLCLALSGPPLLIAMNPWAAPPVYERVGYLMQRTLLNVPAFVIGALLIGTIVGWGRRGGVSARVVAVVLLFLWAKLFLLGASGWMAHTRNIRIAPGRVPDDDALAKVVRLIRDNVPRGSVVLSDPVTSYMLSAFADVKVVTVLHQHGSPIDPIGLERLIDANTAMSPYTTQEEALDVIKRYDVDYVLVNGLFDRPVSDFMAEWDPRATAVLDYKFGTLEQEFRPRIRTDRVILFEIIGTEPADATWYPAVPFIRKAPAGTDPCEALDRKKTLQVAGVYIPTSPALPGEQIDITLVYRKNDTVTSLLPVKLHLRFEIAGYFASRRSFPGDKYVRRFRERRAAAFVRWRKDRRPFAGRFPASMWPIGHDICDTFTLRLPTDLGETTYEVQCKLVEESLIPNLAVKDLFFNNDSYAGTPCTELEIRTFVTR